MNAQQIRMYLLSKDEIKKVIDNHIGRAAGTTEPDMSINTAYEAKVWKAVVPMMQAANDVVKINAKTSQDIIKAVTEGTITLTEGKELMALVKENWEMETLPELIEKVAELESK